VVRKVDASPILARRRGRILAWLQRKQHGIYVPDGSSLHLSDELLRQSENDDDDNDNNDVVAKLMADCPGYFRQRHARKWLFDDDRVFDSLLNCSCLPLSPRVCPCNCSCAAH
jgi:hypothetical protein